MERRDFLLAGLGMTVTALTACSSGTPSAPATPWRAVTPLRIPPLARPGPDGWIDLRLHEGNTAFRPGRPTPTWGINESSYLGPTVMLRRGERAKVRVHNGIPETTTMHWHGMHLPATVDGGPHQPITPGTTWQPQWTVTNRAATCWYHPHPHGATAQHVWRGLAGLLLVDDETPTPAAPRTYGVDDLPVILQDRTITGDGDLVFDTVPTFGQLGDDMLVNGVLGAYHQLTTATVRLRLLNACNARLFNLGFDDDRAFTMIAGDAGLLPSPVPLRRLRLGPGERAEIVVAAGGREPFRLRTVAGDEAIDRGDHLLLELRPAPGVRASASSAIRTQGPGPIVPPAGATVRRLRLQGHDAINGQEMDLTRIDEVVPAGAIEVWEIENTVYAHNLHIHGVEFTVLDREGAPPELWETGRKDTVHLPPKTGVRLAVQLPTHADPRAPYMYHCHILRHEDAGMMGQFVVVEPGTEAATPRTLSTPGPAADHSAGQH